MAITFPLILPERRHHRWARLVVAYLLASLLPWRARALERGNDGRPLSPIDWRMVPAVVHRGQRRGTLEHLMYLHASFWATDAGATWHARTEERFRHWFRHHVVIVDELARTLRKRPGIFSTVCEIGCGAGLFLDHLVGALGPLGVRRFLGIDLSADQCRRNARRWPDERRTFIAGDALPWIRAHAQPRWIYAAIGGVFEYAAPDHLRGLLEAMAARAPSLLAVVEPLPSGYDVACEHPSLIAGGERTWLHHYPSRLRAAGFTILFQTEQEFGGDRWLLLLAGVDWRAPGARDLPLSP